MNEYVTDSLVQTVHATFLLVYIYYHIGVYISLVEFWGHYLYYFFVSVLVISSNKALVPLKKRLLAFKSEELEC